MYETDHNQHLHITGKHRSDCRAADSQCRQAKFPINQQIIKYKIYKYSHKARFHRQYRLSAFPQRTGINLYDCKRRQTSQHKIQILFAINQRRGGIFCNAFTF